MISKKRRRCTKSHDRKHGATADPRGATADPGIGLPTAGKHARRFERSTAALSAAAMETLETRKLLSGTVDAKINFQPGWASTPSGYQVDAGETYRNQGNGLTYGWNADLRNQGADRNKNSRQDLDTLI
ncbi:MAG: hypothetical protein AAF743_14080, partial [Planctomycetota bacterium]